MTKVSIEMIREKIVAQICENMQKLSTLLGFDSEDEGIYIEASYIDDLPEVEVEVYDTYGLDGECDLTESREISALAVTADGEFWLQTTEEDEVYADDLTVEELADIADAVEAEYESRKEDED